MNCTVPHESKERWPNFNPKVSVLASLIHRVNKLMQLPLGLTYVCIDIV